MTLLLVLWFCCIRFTNQENCHSPGDLPAPQLFLNKASNEEGDTMVLKCKVPPLSPFTRVIFCKDGKDLAIQAMQESKFAYNHKVKANSKGRFTCLYQHKDNQNHENNSLLSATQNLSVTDETATSNRTISGVHPDSNGLSFKLILGITIPSLLVIVVVCSLLARKGAMTVGFPRASTTCSQPSRDMVTTSATVGHCTGQKGAGETEDVLDPYAIGEQIRQV